MISLTGPSECLAGLEGASMLGVDLSQLHARFTVSDGVVHTYRRCDAASVSGEMISTLASLKVKLTEPGIQVCQCATHKRMPDSKTFLTHMQFYKALAAAAQTAELVLTEEDLSLETAFSWALALEGFEWVSVAAFSVKYAQAQVYAALERVFEALRKRLSPLGYRNLFAALGSLGASTVWPQSIHMGLARSLVSLPDEVAFFYEGDVNERKVLVSTSAQQVLAECSYRSTLSGLLTSWAYHSELHRDLPFMSPREKVAQVMLVLYPVLNPSVVAVLPGSLVAAFKSENWGFFLPLDSHGVSPERLEVARRLHLDATWDSFEEIWEASALL